MAWLPQWLRADALDTNTIDEHEHEDNQSVTRSESQTQSNLRQSVDEEIDQRRQTWKDTPQDPPLASKWRDSTSSSSSVSYSTREACTPRSLTAPFFNSHHRSPSVKKIAWQKPPTSFEWLNVNDLEEVPLSEPTREERQQTIGAKRRARQKAAADRLKYPEKYWDTLYEDNK